VDHTDSSRGNALKAAALSLVAAFACANVKAIECDDTNTTDLKAVSFDLIPPAGINPFSKGLFTIENLGPNPTRARLYFDIYEVDENYNEMAYIVMVYNDNIVRPGEQLLRTISFTPVHMSEGRYYKGVIRYECDPNTDNNSLYQYAYHTGPLRPDTIFESDFEQPPAEAIAGSFHASAHDDMEAAIEESPPAG